MGRFVELFGILAILVGFAGPDMSLLEVLERQFIFFPRSDVERTPAELGLAYEDVSFETSDRRSLNGWFVPAPARETASDMGNSDVTFLWMHGNWGNMGQRVDDLALFHHLLGVNVFIFDYRGYGNSDGKPSEKGVYRDSRAALDYLAARDDLDPDRIIYFGRSLGAAVAVELALQRQSYGTILFSPFTSIADMGRFHNPVSPVRLLAGKRFDSLSRIRQSSRPLLIIHGEADEIVPIEQGRRLFEAANVPKRFHMIAGARHNDSLGDAGPELWSAIRDFLDSIPEVYNLTDSPNKVMD